jgi:hypothetical protein
MRPIVVTVGPLAGASAANLVASVTPTSGTPLTLLTNTLDMPRRILLTYGSEGAARTLVITGTGITGQTQSETLAVPSGAAGTVASVLDYATITSALPLGSGWTAAATLGTSTIAGSAWIMLDSWALPEVSLQCTVNGTVNYTVQQTLDDPNSISNPVALSAVTWVNSADTAVVAATATAQSNYAYAPVFTRVLLNSGSGSVVYTVSQAGASDNE